MIRGRFPHDSCVTPVAPFLNRRGHSPLLAGPGKWRWVFILAMVFFYLGLMIWPGVFALFGVDHRMGWFLDSYAILASNDAVAAGLNPWEVNPLDPLGRPHVYSHWWLWLSSLGLSREDNFFLGGLFVAAFFAVISWWLRPRSAGAAILCLAVVTAPPVVLAVERGNNDLLIFALLAPVVPMVLSGRRWVRWIAILPLLVATGLKFYPAVAGLVLIVGGERRERAARVCSALVLLVALMISLRPDLEAMNPYVPNPKGLMTLSASHIFIHAGVDEAWAKTAALLSGAVLVAVFRPWRWLQGWSVGDGWRRMEWCMAVLGAVLLTGCFLAGSSYAYRLVYCVLLTPLIWRLATEADVPAKARVFARCSAGLMLFMLWSDMAIIATLNPLVGRMSMEQLLVRADRLAFAAEPPTWAFFLCVSGFLGRFLLDAWDGWRRPAA